MTVPLTAGVITNVAPSGAIIDSSGYYNDWLTPQGVLDGVANEAPGTPASFWLGPAGATNGYFILDLKRDYTVKSIALYNTHNRGNNDSGTARFAVSASDAVGPNVVSLDRYYSMEGSVNDLSPNGVNAMVVDVFQSPIDGVYSNDVPASVTGDTKSLALSGFGESLEIPDPVGFSQPVAYTYAMWYKFLTNDVQPEVRGTSLVLRSAAAGAERSTWSHQLRITPTGKFEAYVWMGAAATVTGTTTVQPNVWYHVACTSQNDGLLHLYVNGHEEGTPVAVVAMWGGGTITEIGTGCGGGDYQPVAELIDDLGIWYSALSPDRILSLSQGKSPLTVGGAKGLILVNSKTVVSGTLSDVSGQAQITPNVYNLSSPVTARYFRFDALSLLGTNSIGLNEFQLMAEADLPTMTTVPAIELTWPPTPYARVPLASPTLNGASWTALTDSPVLVGDHFTLFREMPEAAAFYRLPGPTNGGIASVNIAQGGTIVSASSTYSGVFLPNHVIDGSVDEGTNAPVSYWLAADGVTAADFILDLGSSYTVKSVSLYNTHNRQWNDRGTAQFELYALDGFGISQTQSGIERYYSFDGDLKDQSTNAVDATFLDSAGGGAIDATYSTDVPSVLAGGRSLVFSPSDARLEIPDAEGAAQPTGYTLALWVKFTDLSKPSSIIVRTANSGQELSAWSHQLRVTGLGQFQSYTFDGTTPSVTGTTLAQPGVWYHVATTVENGGWMRLYVNGKEEGTPTKVNTLWTGGARWTIGTGSGNGYSPLAGAVDDLAIWLAPLPAEAVSALVAGAKPTTLKATASTPQQINPRVIASGSLSDTTAQDAIVPDVFPLSPPVTTRYLQFKSVTGTYGANIGLNEIQALGDVSGAKLAIAPAVQLTWPYSPFKTVLQSSPDGTTWTNVPESPSLVDLAWKIFQPAGRQYRLTVE